MCGSETYVTWGSMLQRCNNPNSSNFFKYGGRGITVCERWFKFEHFFKDMGERPKGLTLERINNEKGYVLENCKWASPIEQSRNQRVRQANKTGIAGVFWYEPRQKYCVRIMASYKQNHIGYFANLEDAIVARKKAEIEYWGRSI
jgi:hypothetical protein